MTVEKDGFCAGFLRLTFGENDRLPIGWANRDGIAAQFGQKRTQQFRTLAHAHVAGADAGLGDEFFQQLQVIVPVGFNMAVDIDKTHGKSSLSGHGKL